MLAALTGPRITAEVLAGLASVLRRKRRSFVSDRHVLDTCGTGGDGLSTFNISSLSAVVAAACGALVAKHGNRGVSSPSGSSDFFRALGVPVDVAAAQSEDLLRETGFCFLFAPHYHGAMRHAAKARGELGIRSVMNLVGPLSNPADASYQLIGVFDEELLGPVAEAAHLLGVRRVMAVHGEDGMDEISVCAKSRVVEIDEAGKRMDYVLSPEEFGISRYAPVDLHGTSAAENARMAEELLRGIGPNAVREAVLLNAGAALYLCGLERNIGDGYLRARDALADDSALRKLDQIRTHARRAAEAA
jgi:anthranilate synthase/phosphoribosyltransferase